MRPFSVSMARGWNEPPCTRHDQQGSPYHSCGAILRIIPRLLELGIDALHPLQAKANLMDAQTLSSAFKGRLLFIGGIDTQDLLVRALPDQVKTEVRRVRRLLGLRLVVSPSHEAPLPNVPQPNIEAPGTRSGMTMIVLEFLWRFGYIVTINSKK